MPGWLQILLRAVTVAPTLAEGGVVLGTGIAKEIESNDNPLQKGVNIFNEIAPFANEIGTALVTGTPVAPAPATKPAS